MTDNQYDNHCRPDTAANIVRFHGSRQPDSSAIYYLGETTTYGELDERSNRFASGLVAHGVSAGQRVAMVDKNCPEYFEVMFGAAKAGAVFCGVNWRLTAPEAGYVIRDSEATVLVVGAEFAGMLAEVQADLPEVRTILVVGSAEHSYAKWLSAQPATDPGRGTDPEEIVCQFYTSGTTGRPKGVMLSNRNLMTYLDRHVDALGLHEWVNMVTLPMFHIGGFGVAGFGLASGAPNVLVRDVDPRELLRLIAAHRVTHTGIVPAVISALLALPDIDDYDLSSLRTVVYGASPMTEDVLRRAIDKFGCGFAQSYGMTETGGGIALLAPEEHVLEGPAARRLRAAGKPLPGNECRIVDVENLQDVPAETSGEIWIRSPQNMVGYWKQPEATAETMRADGWLRTGDIGFLDQDGFLYVQDRLKDMIVSGAENIYPAEVESALASHPAIADIAVIGVPDVRWGETPKALVIRTSDTALTEADVIAFARTKLAAYKCPTSVDFVDVLPRNSAGKILKKELRARYWAGRHRQVN